MKPLILTPLQRKTLHKMCKHLFRPKHAAAAMAITVDALNRRLDLAMKTNGCANRHELNRRFLADQRKRKKR